MKLFICCLVLVSSILANPLKPKRLYFPEENDPYHKRFLFVENKQGGLELVDLKRGTVTFEAELSDVVYYLFTRNNENDAYIITDGNTTTLANSPFDSSKLSVFICHGWNNDHLSPVNVLLKEVLLEKGDVNVFVVDWSGAGTDNYLNAQAAVLPVGQFVGEFINGIQDLYSLTGSSFVLFGHSLGGHVAGNAGAAVKSKVDHIIGLDPASPMFTLDNTENRLDPSDANFVQVIHTGGAILGFKSSIGHSDYYPNGGMTQPGCGDDAAGSCAHSRAYVYLGESISRGAVFNGVQCSSYQDYTDGLCEGNPISALGQLEIDKEASGDYFLNTNAEAPFGMG